MWLSMVMNGMVLTVVIVGVYLVALMNFCDGQILQKDIYELGPGFHICPNHGSENIRAYISRSFTRPMWHDILGNPSMQKAIVMAQVCLYVAVLVPYLSDRILGLRGLEIGVFGWALALAGPVGCFVLSESCKLISAYQARKYQDSLAMDDSKPQLPLTARKAAALSKAPAVEQKTKKMLCCMPGRCAWL
ncbi:unnamed protein product [Effrenium voratum]|uniref:Uncharacterized protein n=1 Tax=Effrenium voratum TaxID=2562239 RepID=A0AA36I8K9_9DINO|nr:unnamed protein product [Effrenium voratum]